MPPQRPSPAPSMSQTRTGKVRNRTGHALSGAIAAADKAPAAKAISQRRHPHASTIAWTTSFGFTAWIGVEHLGLESGRPRHQLAAHRHVSGAHDQIAAERIDFLRRVADVELL